MNVTNYKPILVPELEQQINSYISWEARERIYELEPSNSTARLKAIMKKLAAEEPTARFGPKILQYAIGGDPYFPRCISSMVKRLVREDPNFPIWIFSHSTGGKNPKLSAERDQELLELLED